MRARIQAGDIILALLAAFAVGVSVAVAVFVEGHFGWPFLVIPIVVLALISWIWEYRFAIVSVVGWVVAITVIAIAVVAIGALFGLGFKLVAH